MAKKISSVSGLDFIGTQIIETRFPIVYAFLEACSFIHPLWREALAADDRAQLQRFLNMYEQAPETGRLPDQQWIALAEQLDVHRSVEEALLRRCYRMHVFDTFVDGKYVSPDPSDIFPKVRTILETEAYKGNRQHKLLEQNLCRDEAATGTFFYEYTQLPKRVASVARGVVLAYLSFGPLGLLQSSTYPCAEELFRLEQLALNIMPIATQTRDVRATLRADLIALYHAFQSVNSKLWQQYLLYEPAQSAARHLHQHKFTLEIRRELVIAVTHERSCNESNAALLLDIFLKRGLFGLIEMRSEASLDSPHSEILFERIKKTLDQHLGQISFVARQEIERLLTHLVTVLDETKVMFPLRRLLRDYPSSPFRIRCGRRFSFGAGAMIRQQRQQRPKLLTAGSKRVRQRIKPIATAQKEDLFPLFAKRASLSISDARWRLRNLITYGAFGLLSQEQRLEAVDARLISHLYFHKLGYIEGILDWQKLFHLSSQYANQLGIPPLSQQVARGIFNSLEKPRYWHGGIGEATATARQRATLVLDVPRLHQSWLLIPVQLQLNLINTSGYPLTNGCHVLLLVEGATNRPMGCWISQDKPGSAEIGLALYQGIWHPGASDWPLRGIPETLQVPLSLKKQWSAELDQAMLSLMTSIQFVPNRYWSKLEIIKHLTTVGPDIIHQMAGMKPLTIEQAQAHVLDFLKTNWFSGHDGSPLPARFRRPGLSMPGHDTPAAGWLLPSSGEVQTIRNGVVDRANIYTHPQFLIEPGLRLQKRSFPFPHDHTEPGIFVEIKHRQSTDLIYLTRSSERLPT